MILTRKVSIRTSAGMDFFVGSLKNDGKGKYDRSSFQEQPERRFCIFVVMPETALHILAGITCKVPFSERWRQGKVIVPPFYGNSGNGADIYSCLNYG